MAQPTTFRLKPHHTDGANIIVDKTNSIFAEDYAPRSLTAASCAVDDSGGYANGPGGDNDSFSTLPLQTMHPMLWMIQGAALTILVAAPPMIGTPSVISPLPLRLLQRPLRRLSPLL